MLASREITTYVDRGREYPVIVQARAEDRRTPTDLANIFVRSGQRRRARAAHCAGPAGGGRGGAGAAALRPAALDHHLGVACRRLRPRQRDPIHARRSPPRPCRPRRSSGFAGQSKEFLETSGGVALTFALALLIVFLVLAAQFESFIHPLIIMLTVPLGLAGALLSLWLTGNSLNVYSQIGIVLLVGLMAKNGILIVEFANQLRDEGRTIREAVLEASAIRLRPVVMTMVSTMLGGVPLVLATGAGAESRAAIGMW